MFSPLHQHKLGWIETYGASIPIDGQILAYCGVQSMQKHQGLPGAAQIYFRIDNRSSDNCPLIVRSSSLIVNAVLKCYEQLEADMRSM